MPFDHALISGGSSGIGQALARRLVGHGWNVSIIARDTGRLTAAAAELESARQHSAQQVLPLSADVSDADATTDAVRAAMARLGAPALVIACAGIVIPGVFHALPADSFRRTMEVNYLGAVNLVRAALPAMRARRSGRIVLVSSGAGLIGLYGYSAYAPSKFAIRGLGEALRSELKPEGIAVSVAYPPDTDTPQFREEVRMRPEATSRIAAGARLRSADEVARSILAGAARGRFTIAPGWEMGALAVLHSLIAPLLHRFWFDPVIAGLHGRGTGTRP